MRPHSRLAYIHIYMHRPYIHMPHRPILSMHAPYMCLLYMHVFYMHVPDVPIPYVHGPHMRIPFVPKCLYPNRLPPVS
jgi:hypothetical protein